MPAEQEGGPAGNPDRTRHQAHPAQTRQAAQPSSPAHQPDSPRTRRCSCLAEARTNHAWNGTPHGAELLAVDDEVGGSIGIQARERSAQELLTQPIEAQAWANGTLTPVEMNALNE